MSDETAVESAGLELVEQDHGGALLKGGKPGNKGGGRTPSQLRRAALKSLDERLQIYEEIADSKDSMARDRIAALRRLEAMAFGNSMPGYEIKEKMEACFAVLEQRLAPAVSADLILEMKRIWDGR